MYKEFKTFMTSLEFAELVNKLHHHVLRDIRDEADKIGEINTATRFGFSEYKDGSGKSNTLILMSVDGYQWS